jgi:hypothetical protein
MEQDETLLFEASVDGPARTELVGATQPHAATQSSCSRFITLFA